VRKESLSLSRAIGAGWIAPVALIVSFGLSAAAEYHGADIDGSRFDATAFCYTTGNYYYVEVEFSGDEATIYFPKGGYITVTLDDEEIDDPRSISAFDYERGAYWDLDVDGLD
jgi:hypothetical protein